MWGGGKGRKSAECRIGFITELCSCFMSCGRPDGNLANSNNVYMNLVSVLFNERIFRQREISTLTSELYQCLITVDVDKFKQNAT